MEEYQKRMIEEYADLNQKIIKLDKYIHSKEFNDLPAAKQFAMFWQMSGMTSYIQALGSRCLIEGISEDLKKALNKE